VETAALAQRLVYGRTAAPGENPYFLNAPFFLIPLFFPFALIADPAIARGLWILVGQAALLGTASISLALTGWQVPRRFQVVYSLLAVFGFYPTIALVDGTPAVVLALLYATILWTYSRGFDELAGAMFVLSLYEWEIGLGFLLLFQWRVFRDKRWGVLGGFAMTLSVLMAISFLLYPGWILPFLTATAVMARSTHGHTLASTLLSIAPGYGGRVARGFSILVLCLLAVEWAAGRRADFRHFVWTACLALAAMPVIGVRTETSQLAVIAPGFAVISAAAMVRSRAHTWFAWVILAIASVVPWGVLVRSYFFHDPYTRDYLAILYPLSCLMGLYWTRWWFLQPHSTWLDQVRQQGSG
jgi:hypothetical protein